MNKAILCGAAVMVLAPATAMAQWSDDFESYGDGQVLYNVGGWTGWDDVVGAAGTAVSSPVYGGERSIRVTGAGDAVHPFSGYTSGQWTLSCQMYLARNDHTGDTYFIVNNEYNHGGPYTWTIEMQFDVTTGRVLDDFRSENAVSIAYDRWAEIRIDFDLDNDAQTTWYDGQLLSSGTMTRSNGDPLAIAGIDLFSNGPTAHYDNFNLIPAPGALSLLGLGGIGLISRRRRR